MLNYVHHLTNIELKKAHKNCEAFLKFDEKFFSLKHLEKISLPIVKLITSRKELCRPFLKYRNLFFLISINEKMKRRKKGNLSVPSEANNCSNASRN